MSTDKKDQDYYNQILAEGEKDSIFKGVLCGIASTIKFSLQFESRKDDLITQMQPR
jgi:hypothetical protein